MSETNWGNRIANVVIYTIAGLLLASLLIPHPYPCRNDKVSRAESEMRTLQNCLENFFLDNNTYPLPSANGLISDASIVIDGKPRSLTTPVSYISYIPLDPFHSDGHKFSYGYGSNGKTYYILTSWGPDSKDGLNGNPIFNELEYTDSRLDENRRIKQDDAAFRGADRTLREFLYDASNGVASAGEIIRVGP